MHVQEEAIEVKPACISGQKLENNANNAMKIYFVYATHTLSLQSRPYPKRGRERSDGN